MKKIKITIISIIVLLTFISSIVAGGFSGKPSIELNALLGYAFASEENSGNGYSAVYFTCEYTDEFGITHSGYYIDCHFTGYGACTPTGCIMD